MLQNTSNVLKHAKNILALLNYASHVLKHARSMSNHDTKWLKHSRN